MRESRVRNPLFRSPWRKSGFKIESARESPMRTAPACPPTPPPLHVALTSSSFAVFVNFKASLARISHATFLRYESTALPLTSNFPLPGRMNTRATAFLRRPVPYPCVFKTPSVGCTLEPNSPPQNRSGTISFEVPLGVGRIYRANGCGFRSEEHTSELQSHLNLVCRLLLEKKKKCCRSQAPVRL